MRYKAVPANVMSEIDRKAQQEYGIPECVLMENAGRSVGECIIADSASIVDERVAVFCGKGNNGGDGFVIARYLANESPAKLTVFAVDTAKVKPGASSDNLSIVRNMGIDIRHFNVFISECEREDFTVGVDAVFGTGFKGELTVGYERLFGKINDCSMKRYAVDVPSGLDSTSGEASVNCLKADKTVTFGLPKTGFFMGDGPGVCGEVIVRNIGFPKKLLDSYC